MRKIRKELISTMITAISVASIVCSSPSVVLAADISRPSESYIEADLSESENPTEAIDTTLSESKNPTDTTDTTPSVSENPTDTTNTTPSVSENPTDTTDTAPSVSANPTETIDTTLSESENLESEAATEQTVGSTTVTIYNDITATFDDKTGALVLDSEGGTLSNGWQNDWSNATGLPTSDIKSIKVGSGTVYLPKNSSSLFKDLEGLVTFDSTGFDTSAVTDMSFMFYGCTNLTQPDVSSFDTSKVINMNYIFANCTALTSLNINSFDTSHVEEMQGMFMNCSGLKTLDLTGFNTSNLKYMHFMFRGCGKLTGLDLSSFDMSNVAGATRVFEGCTALQLLKTPKINTNEIDLPVSMYDEAGNEYTALPITNKSLTLKASDNPFLKATIATKSPSYTYKGWYRKPNPVVKLGSKTLVNGTDYELSYKNNKNVGTATVFAHGIGKYSGSISCSFQITESNIALGTARTKYQAYKYTGKARKPALILEVNGRTLVKGTDYSVWYSNNSKVGTATVGAVGKGNYTGKIQCTFKIIDNEDLVYVPVYRMYNHQTGEHFFTTDPTECTRYPMSGTWVKEGIAWYSPRKSGKPVYRVSNPNGGYEHHYTTSKSERDWLVSLGWRDEGIGFYSVTKDGLPVYRHYHPVQRTGNHHYTTSKTESERIVRKYGWLYEGIAFYVGDPDKIIWSYLGV